MVPKNTSKAKPKEYPIEYFIINLMKMPKKNK